MNDASPLENFELHVRDAAARFNYPPTPDIVDAVLRKSRREMQRGWRPTLRPALIITILLITLIGALWSVPSVRAAIIEFFQIGVIRIWVAPPTPTPTSTPTSAGHSTAVSTLAPTATPADLLSFLDLDGQTTLEKAQETASFHIKVPTYPDDLGDPNLVFLQDLGDSAVILVWTEPEAPEKVRLGLFQIGEGSWIGEKGAPYQYEQVTVNGRNGLWATGPYPLLLKNRKIEMRRIVSGSALIWEQDGITYRLEGAISLEEAIRIAESLKDLP